MISPLLRKAARGEIKTAASRAARSFTGTPSRCSEAASSEAPHKILARAPRAYSELTIGVPKEVAVGERRVAQVPETVAKFHKAGFQVVVQSGAGEHANFSDGEFAEAGAKIVGSAKEVYDSDIVVKVRAPDASEVKLLTPKQTLVSMLQPGIAVGARIFYGSGPYWD